MERVNLMVPEGGCYTASHASGLISEDNPQVLYSFVPERNTYEYLYKLREVGAGPYLFSTVAEAGPECVLYGCNLEEGVDNVIRNSRIVLQDSLASLGHGGVAVERALKRLLRNTAEDETAEAGAKPTGGRCVSLFASGVDVKPVRADEDVAIKKYEPLLNHMAHTDFLAKDANKWRVIVTLYSDVDPVVSAEQKKLGKFLFFYRPRRHGVPSKQYLLPCPPFSVVLLHSSLRDGLNGWKHGVRVVAPEQRKQYIVASVISNVELTGDLTKAAEHVATTIFDELNRECQLILQRQDCQENLAQNAKEDDNDDKVVFTIKALRFNGKGTYFLKRGGSGPQDQENTDEWAEDREKALEKWKEDANSAKCRFEDCSRNLAEGSSWWCSKHRSNESRGLPKAIRGVAAGAPECQVHGCGNAVMSDFDKKSGKYTYSGRKFCRKHASEKARGSAVTAAENAALDLFFPERDAFLASNSMDLKNNQVELTAKKAFFEAPKGAPVPAFVDFGTNVYIDAKRCLYQDEFNERKDPFTNKVGGARCMMAKKVQTKRGELKVQHFCNKHVSRKERVAGSCPMPGDSRPEWKITGEARDAGKARGRKAQVEKEAAQERGIRRFFLCGASATAAAAVPSAGADDAGGASASAGDVGGASARNGASDPKRQRIGYSKEAKGKGPAE